jgi:hypothetical protein
MCGRHDLVSDWILLVYVADSVSVMSMLGYRYKKPTSLDNVYESGSPIDEEEREEEEDESDVSEY